MAPSIQPVRGTQDLLGDSARRFQHVVETARGLASTWGFDEWITPVIEDTRVFARSLGETSDVVSKEMYSFEDRGGDSITLRPENTAGVCRALVTNGLTQTLPQKVFYAGPMFRYERPQKGRYRQFHQIGVEILGASEPLADAETIACAAALLRQLGVDHDVVLELNTLGDAPSRAAYREELVRFLLLRESELSIESRERLKRNPMRVLDSKDEGDRAVAADAPTIEAFLNEGSRAHWEGVQHALAAFGVGFVVNPRIVRGLDYYSHTAFEFTTNRLGAQGTVLAGGRYDGLVQEMGGPQTPSVGWAAGIERLSMLLIEAPVAPRSIAVVPVGAAAEAAAIGVLAELRQAGLRAEIAYRGNLKRRMERAAKVEAPFALIFGEEELASAQVVVRDLRAGTQERVARASLLDHLTHRR